MKMSPQTLQDTAIATAGTTLASVPLESLIEPVTNVISGVIAVLIIRGIGWIAKKFKL